MVTRGQASPANRPTLEQWRADALLIAYRIATYQPRDRAAWKRALDEAALEPEARAVASEYLGWAWGRDRSMD